jgi:hypothetical protein
MARKPAPKKEDKTEEVKESKKYVLEIHVNDTVTKCETDNIIEALSSFSAPEIIKTEVLFKIKKGSKSVEKSVSVFEGRKVFHNRTYLELLAESLITLVG